MTADRERLYEPHSSEERLALALEDVQALAEYARTEHLTLADELLTEFVALLVTRSSTVHGAG